MRVAAASASPWVRVLTGPNRGQRYREVREHGGMAFVVARDDAEQLELDARLRAKGVRLEAPPAGCVIEEE